MDLNPSIENGTTSRSPESSDGSASAAAKEIEPTACRIEALESRLAESERALARSEASYAALVKTLSDVVFHLNRDGVLLECHYRDDSKLAMPPEAFLGKHVNEFLPESVVNETKRSIEAAFETGDVQKYEFQFPVPYDSKNLNDFEARVVVAGEDEALILCSNVTERNITRQTLDINQESLELAIEAGRIGLGTWDWDMCTDKATWSDELFHLVGLEPGREEPGYETWSTHVHPDDLAHVKQTLKDAMANRQPFNKELRILREDGSVHWVVARGRFDYDDGGEAIRMRGVVADFNEHKQVEKKLRESVKNYRNLFDNNVAGVAVTTFDGKFLEANEAICNCFGYGSNESSSINAEEFYIDPRHRSTYLSALKRDGKTTNVLLKMRHKSGRSIWAKCSSALTVWNGQDAIISTITDITDRKNAEAKYQLLVEEVNGILYQYDTAAKKVTYISPHAEKMLGYPTERWINEPEFWENHIHPDDREEAMRMAAATFDKLQDCAYQYRMIAADGREVWIHDSVRMIPHENQEGHQMHSIMLDITQQKQTEQKLAEAEERFRLAAQSVSDLIWVRDADSSHLQWFGNVDNALGYEQDEFPHTYEAYRKRIHPEDHDLVRAIGAEATRKPGSFQVEYRMRGKEGNYRYWSDTWESVFDANGAPVRFVGSVQDITERKRTEEAILIRDRAIAAIDVGVMITDPNLEDNPTVYCNEAYTSITGYTEQEALGRNCRYLQGEEQDQEALDIVRSAIQKGRDCQVVLRNYRKDGSMFWNELTISPVRNDAGRLVNFIGIQKDITDRVESERALREREQLLTGIIDNSAAAIFVKDIEGRYFLVNQHFKDLSCICEAEIIGKTDYDIFPKKAADIYRANDQRALRAKTSIRVEESVLHSDGPHTYFSVKFPLLTQEGQPFALCGIATDVTDNKRIEKELQLKQAEIARVSRLSMLGELTGGIAHELNQPLTAIANYAEAMMSLASTEGPEGEAFQHTLLQIQNTAFRTSSIISRLRGLVQRAAPHRSNTDINELIVELLAFYSPQLDRSKIEVRLDLSENIPALKLDSLQIQQVLLNLTKNAHEAMKGTSDDEKVLTYRTRRQGEHVVVSVTDTGRGLPDDNPERLFDYFYSTTPGGLGVGLQVCRSIMESHRGKVLAQNNPGGGATFRLSFPLRPGELINGY